MHTILVADDSVTIQKAVEIVFDKEPFTVVNVGSAAEAIAKTRELRPHLVLVDHFMADKNGYEIAQALHEDPSTSAIPVLMLSGSSAAYDENRARAAGVAGHVPKPFDCQTLLERVRTLLGVANSLPTASATGAAAPAVTSPPSAAIDAPSASAAASAPPAARAPLQNPWSVTARPPSAASPTPGLSSMAPSPFRAASGVDVNDPFGLGGAVRDAPTSAAAAAAEAPPPFDAASSPADDPFPRGGHADEQPVDMADLDVGDMSAAPSQPAAHIAPATPSGNGAAAAAAEIARAPETGRAGSAWSGAVESVVDKAAPAIAQAGGQVLGRAALDDEARQIIERIAWEVVPELAEVIIREEIKRLLADR
jgi:CheY-like chemotaxis protein